MLAKLSLDPNPNPDYADRDDEFQRWFGVEYAFDCAHSRRDLPQ